MWSWNTASSLLHIRHVRDRNKHRLGILCSFECSKTCLGEQGKQDKKHCNAVYILQSQKIGVELEPSQQLVAQ